MTLQEFLKTTTQAEFARELGVSQGLVSQWVRGVTEITWKQAIKIEEATEGLVPRHVLRSDIWKDPNEAA